MNPSEGSDEGFEETECSSESERGRERERVLFRRDEMHIESSLVESVREERREEKKREQTDEMCTGCVYGAQLALCSELCIRVRQMSGMTMVDTDETGQE